MTRQSDPSERPDGWAKINMAWTIDERCEASKKFRATFYKQKEGCPAIPKSLMEGVEAGRDNMKPWVKM